MLVKAFRKCNFLKHSLLFSLTFKKMTFQETQKAKNPFMEFGLNIKAATFLILTSFKK